MEYFLQLMENAKKYLERYPTGKMVLAILAKAKKLWNRYPTITTMAGIFTIIFFVFIINSYFDLMYAQKCVVHIEASGKLYYTSTLIENDVIYVPGPLGETEVRIANNTVYVENSPCPHKFCVESEPIDDDGEVIACYPNDVVISIVEIDEYE